MLIHVALVFSILFLTWKWLLRRSKLDLIPGPGRWPVIGNSLQVDLQRPHVTFTNWTSLYGNVFRVNLAGTPTIIVSGTEELHEMLVSKGEDFGHRGTFSYRIGMWSMGFRDVIFRDAGKQHRSMKKSMMRGLKVHNIKGIESRVQDIVFGMLDVIRSKNGSPFDPSDMIFSFTFQSIYAFMFNTEVGWESSDYKALQTFEQVSSRALTFAGPGAILDFMPWLRFFGNQTYKDLLDMNQIARTFYGSMKARLETGELDGGWFKQLIQDALANPDVYATEEDVVMNLMDMFAAGMATTTSSVVGFINCMVHFPEVQKKLQKELDLISEQSEISYLNRDRFPYTFACVLEATRFVTPVSLALPHVTSCSTTLAGYQIPKATQVFANLWGQNHNQNLFPDPFKFEPERFLDNEGNILSAGEEPRKHLFTFGAGTRVCAGETFAMSRLFLVIAHLTKSFTILPATKLEDQASVHPEDFTLGVVVDPPKYKVRMVPR